MILEGNERGFGAELARHLLNLRDNDHVTVHVIDGFVADDLSGAFAEAEAISGATQGRKYLFSLSLNPPPDQNVPIEVFEAAIAEIEKKLGLVGQPRAIVFHEKLGRRHAHCVWSRIDAGQMKAIKLPHYKRKLVDVTRLLYRTHNWEMPEGFKDADARDPLSYSRQEAGQAKRAKADPTVLKAMFRRCWEQSDSRSAFATALWAEGYVLARGARRGFVAVDANGKIWSLSRWCGVKSKELRARLGSEDTLQSGKDAHAAFADLDGRAPEGRRVEPNVEFERRRHALVERQRQDRTTLRDVQEERRIAELKERQTHLPKCLKAAWMRLTGQYQVVIDRLAEQAQAATQRDRQEQQALIDQHLVARVARDLDHAQINILAELGGIFDNATRPDPRQRLMLAPDDIPYSARQLIRNPALILDHISHKQAQFRRTDILRELAKRLPDPMVLKIAADTAMASNDLIVVGGEDAPQYTTRDYSNGHCCTNGLMGFTV